MIKTLKSLLDIKAMNSSQKIHLFFYLIFLLFIISQAFTDWRGQIPAQDQLTYTEGYVGVVRAGENGNLIRLRLLEDPKKSIVFECTHPTSFTVAPRGCGDLKYLEKYLDKPAKIGWYDPSTSFELRPHGHQIVTMLANGDYFKKYEQTKRVNRHQNQGLVILTLIFISLSYVFFITLIYPKSQ